MIIGIPKETKTRERRVGLLPVGARDLTQLGHEVWIQKSAGIGSGFSDEAYVKAGAKIVETAEEAWSAQMVVKVKEPLPDEYRFLREDLTLFTYLHLAAEKELTYALLEAKTTGIAYETIQDSVGRLPLLKPMSEVAGRMATQVGAYYLQSSWNEEGSGRGVLLGGVPGVRPSQVTIIGGGIAGSNAAKMAIGLGADVTLLDINPSRLEYLDDVYHGRLHTLMSHSQNIYESVITSDLVIGTVLIAGAKAPKLVTRKMIEKMNPGSVIVDVSVDQGGCVETAKPTTHDTPTFTIDDVTHYCVANMPGAVPRTSTIALTNVTLPFVIKLAQRGAEKAAHQYPEIALGFNTYQGKLVRPEVAEAHGIEYSALEL